MEKGKELEMEIELSRELMNKKIEENLDANEILKVSQELDKLIVAYYESKEKVYKN